MYNLPHFTENNPAEIISFIKGNSMAIVAGCGSDFPSASHLPLHIIDNGNAICFGGHLMRNTDHHKAFLNNENVLVIFNSLPAYINADWYAEPAVASTVNYMAVHIKGKISFKTEEETYNEIKRITDTHIGKNSAASFEKIPGDYIKTNLKAIVGFKIEVIKMDATFKLSQNMSEADRINIIKQLEKRNTGGDVFIAAHMKAKLLPKN
jgi:transcriptional regulator